MVPYWSAICSSIPLREQVLPESHRSRGGETGEDYPRWNRHCAVRPERLVRIAPKDQAVLALLWGGTPFTPANVRELLARAELHGLLGIAQDRVVASGIALDASIFRDLETKAIAQRLNHEAHLGMLRRIDAALDAANLRGVLLKGALFAERFYPRPETRTSTDIDLLVDPDNLDASAAALQNAGYEPLQSAREGWFRDNHHHLHLGHPHALPLELHFHAHRGFGRILPSRPLLARSRSSEEHRFQALSLLAPEDELVYLAVHAASHRFARLGWLYDCKLLLETMSDEEILIAAARAKEWGYTRPLALAARLLRKLFAVDAKRLAPLDLLGRFSTALLDGITSEPHSAVLRSLTRLVYVTSLSPSPMAAVQYVRVASLDRLRHALRQGR